MTAGVPRVSGLALRPLAGGATRWAATVGEAELLLRRLAGQLPAGAAPRRFEVAVLFAGGARQHAEIALCRDDSYCEASPWEGLLLRWAKDCIEGNDRPRALQLVRMTELVRHVAHHRAVGEFVDVYEHMEDDLDEEDAARRDRVLASPPPAPLTGSNFRHGRPLDVIRRYVRRDIEAAVVAGMLPEGLQCAVRIEPYEGRLGIEIEVVRVPGLWIPDLCEMCIPVAYRVRPMPEGGLTCRHTPTLAGYSIAADGVLLTLLAIGDVYNRDSGIIGDGAYVVESGFPLGTCFDGALGRAQR